MVIRLGKIADAPALQDLLARAYEDEREHYPATTLEEIEDGFQNGDIWFAGELDSRIIGCVCVYSEGVGQCGRIGLLAVEPPLWNRGYGRQLMEDAEKSIRSAGCPCTAIGVLNFKSPRLFEFYRRLGYIDTGHRANTDIEPMKPCEIIVMAKTF